MVYLKFHFKWYDKSLSQYMCSETPSENKCCIVIQYQGRLSITVAKFHNSTLLTNFQLTWVWFWAFVLNKSHRLGSCRADSRFVASQWKNALLFKDVYHWLDASLKSALPCHVHRYIKNEHWIWYGLMGSDIEATFWIASPQHVMNEGNSLPISFRSGLKIIGFHGFNHNETYHKTTLLFYVYWKVITHPSGIYITTV